MAYGCELNQGQWLYLDCSGDQTSVTIASSSPGQQQQSSQSLTTGSWTAAPAAFRVGGGVAVKLRTAGGDRWLQLQGNRVGLLHQSPDLHASQPLLLQETAAPRRQMQPMQPMEPMQPMQPLPPLKMGDMQMSLNPMEMRMGNMQLRMGTPAAAASPRFCSQCGAAVQVDDRFCAKCGHQLGA